MLRVNAATSPMAMSVPAGYSHATPLRSREKSTSAPTISSAIIISPLKVIQWSMKPVTRSLT